ncbi:elongation factor G [Synergistes jonesii]|uniref:Elongation factor G n=1 Tax=Synergistes jonesii TaxID=2754 RepID=A0A073IVJ2_9BACT|nr:elongation factor G [Synergistes jonesii]KEJ93476.1 elongation factor G [Synergistes jonesii]OFB61457.1 elongation factor G [Synergistes jonesii]OFB65265.1 elongation factor G [Synergistes jonesii]OFB68615.1 elongation factor G [Synergistes jonesii]OFB69281.1 elongation factor G [Synergistes jonesii]
MGTRKPEDIRSIALISHGGAGKTTLNEAFLFDAGLISRMGRIEDKNTVSDFDSEEQKRGISISTSLSTIPYKNKTLYILDTPGFADFVGEQRCAMRVADGAVVLVNATAGVEVQTQSVWEFAQYYETPACFFISKLDRENTDFDDVVADIQENISKNAVPLYLPVGNQLNFKGVVNVLTKKAYMYKGDGGKEFTEGDVPADMADAVEAAREALIERAVEADDEIMMRYLDGEEISLDELLAVLRKAVCARQLFPIIPGSGSANIGVTQLMDLIADYMPSPKDMLNRTALKGEEVVNVPPDEDGPFLGFVFKVMVDPYVGKLSFVKVFSGKLTSDQSVYNVTEEQEERISSFRFMRGKESVEGKEIVLGDIVAIPKLESTIAGDTLGTKGETLQFRPIQFPKPVYSVAVMPKSRADEDKLGNAIAKMLKEDRTLSFVKDPKTNDAVLSGMGDMHLDIMLSKIKERYKVDLDTRLPKVPYRETIRKKASAQGKHKKQSGGRGQYGDVWFELAPLEKNAGIEFIDRVVGGAVPKNYIPAAEKGLREAAARGYLAGYPATDFSCAIFDGSYHEVDSSEMAFKIAASLAFKNCMEKANPVIMEPVMNVEVTVPEECLGDVMGDFNSRRGRIMGIDSEGKLQIVKAQCPLSEMFRYAIILRSMTSGRGSFSMEYSHYEELPPDIEKKVIEQAAQERKEEEE